MVNGRGSAMIASKSVVSCHQLLPVVLRTLTFSDRTGYKHKEIFAQVYLQSVCTLRNL